VSNHLDNKGGVRREQGNRATLGTRVYSIGFRADHGGVKKKGKDRFFGRNLYGGDEGEGGSPEVWIPTRSTAGREMTVFV